MIGHMKIGLFVIGDGDGSDPTTHIYQSSDDGSGYEDVMRAIALLMAMAMSLVMAVMGMALVAQLLSHHSSVGSGSGQ